MSLIKAADVPKHLADRLKSRRLSSRLSRGTSPVPPTEKTTVPPAGELPTAPAVS
jgi:hypothetical protein